uniref:Binding-protein-dependent transporter inner membrane protein (ABC.PE.P1) n=1 Tax=uncultured marine thaumarchaeote KM3_54_G03 TaxID=1456192 RepID=A0A075HAA6_9ARCH|nr:binding-protein-dependent transporter inner membrane protein (ABC.PE.P1) [uncultured marine thaumarchaeote KM3_54_G03]
MKSKTGLIGIGILSSLVIVSLIAATTIPIDTFKQWNNPNSWISYPKATMPIWVNYFLEDKIPEHVIIENPSAITKKDVISVTSHQFTIEYMYDDFPNDFIYEFSAEYSDSPLLQISVIRPDKNKMLLLSTSLPYSDEKITHHERIFSTDDGIRKNAQIESAKMKLFRDNASSEDLIFADEYGHVLKGNYLFLVNLYDTRNHAKIIDSKLILGGKAFGIMGTDELRRDLIVGLLWGTPLALLIGISVAVGSVVVGLIYGVYAGFKGRKTDETMMRFNDIIYALPALPFLIILAVTISNSIFMMIGFLMIFSWVGIAKVSRSMSLQIKTKQYIEASKIMGQKDSKIIFKHIIPQLLPYAFASIAISVPAAITTEAGLSFLGLGDPTFPTWGQILHDANVFGAAARGLWWWIVPPGVMIAITGLAFVFIGNALDTIVNPKLKR